MNEPQCRAFVQNLIPVIQQHVLNGAPLRTHAGVPISNNLRVIEGNSANATLYAIGPSFGVEVTDLILAGMISDTSIKFAIAHELGHVFSAAVLDRICLPPLPTIMLNGSTILFKPEHSDDAMRGGPPEEVIADLGATYALIRMGINPRDIIESIHQDRDTIFDQGWNGNHPPAQMRIQCVISFVDLLSSGCTFDDAMKAVCLSMIDSKPKH